MKRFIPLIIFTVLVIFLAIGLTLDPHQVPSPLIDKPAPTFQLSELDAPGKIFSSRDMLGHVWLLNVWASWCVSCREEHPLLVDLAKQGGVALYGLDYKDKSADALAWLADRGNPYRVSVFDGNGLVGIDYGVYGVPETFVIDKHGVIRYKQIGPLTPDALRNTILPLVKKLDA